MRALRIILVSKRCVVPNTRSIYQHPIAWKEQHLSTATVSISDKWTRSTKRLLLLDFSESQSSSCSSSWSSKDWQEALGAIRYWKDLNTVNGVEKAWQLMDRAVHEERTRNAKVASLDVELNTALVRSVVLAWSLNPGGVTAREILERVHTYHSNVPKLCPDSQMYTMIIKSAINNGEYHAHDLAEEVIHTFLDGNLQSTMPHPDTIVFNVAIDALAKSGVEDAPQRAEALLQKMKDLTGDGWANVKPDRQTYNIVMSVWAKSQHPGAAQRAEVLLEESPQPDAISFSIVMDAWCKSENIGSADRCYQILQHMKEFYRSGKNEEIKPNAISYGTVIAAFAKSGRAKEAQTILQELLDEFDRTKDADLLPNRFHFSSLIDAWAKSCEKGAAQKAEALLEAMHTMATATNNRNLFPSVISYTSVLHAWAKSNDPLAVSHAVAILQKMHEMDKLGFHDLKPNIRTYSTVLDCLAKSQSKYASNRAEAFFKIILDRNKAGDEDLKPNMITFTTMINAFVKSRRHDAAEKAEEIFVQMKAYGVQPDVHSFSSLISAWSNSRDPRAATKAERYLREMTKLYKSGEKRCKPNAITFTSVIHAWSTSKDENAVHRVQAILNEMKRLDEFEGHMDCRPNVITYTSFLNVVARSKSKSKAEMAFAILTEMNDRFIQPNIRTYNAVLMACAYSEPFDWPTRKKAFHIALQIIERIHFDMKASVETYCFFFQSAVALGHDKEVELVYKLCCKAGFDNHELIQRHLMKAAPHLVQKRANI